MLESAVSCYEILVSLLSTAIIATTQGGFPVALCGPVKPSHSPCGYQGNRTENLF